MSPRLRFAAVAGLLGTAALALAIYPSLSNTLIGIPTNGATPSGTIRVDQSKLNSAPAKVEIRLQNVSLPNGTPLGVVVDGAFYGTLYVVSRQAQATISTYLQTGRNAAVYITTADGTLVAYSTSSWKT